MYCIVHTHTQEGTQSVAVSTASEGGVRPVHPPVEHPAKVVQRLYGGHQGRRQSRLLVQHQQPHQGILRLLQGVCLFVCLLVCLFVCLLVCLFVCLFVCLLVCFFLVFSLLFRLTFFLLPCLPPFLIFFHHHHYHHYSPTNPSQIWNHPDILYQVVEQRKDDNDLDLDEAKGDGMANSRKNCSKRPPTNRLTGACNDTPLVLSVNYFLSFLRFFFCYPKSFFFVCLDVTSLFNY